MSDLQQRWQLSPAAVFARSPLMPVLVFQEVDHALPIAEALLEGGIGTLEVTLRSEAALPAISALAKALPQALVGAGTVTTPEQLRRACDAGAAFLISPGITPALLEAGTAASVPLIPGIATVSELMQGIDSGYTHFKFFPAESNGGPRALRAIAGPFPGPRFCPTGGITADNAGDYLALSNVDCVGGSWLVGHDAVQRRDWAQITRLARDSLARLKR